MVLQTQDKLSLTRKGQCHNVPENSVSLVLETSASTPKSTILADAIHYTSTNELAIPSVLAEIRGEPLSPLRTITSTPLQSASLLPKAENQPVTVGTDTLHGLMAHQENVAEMCLSPPLH